MNLDNQHKKQRRIAEERLEIAISFIYRNVKDKYQLEELNNKLRAIK